MTVASNNVFSTDLPAKYGFIIVPALLFIESLHVDSNRHLKLVVAVLRARVFFLF